MITFERSEWQKTVWDDSKRYRVINCGRRAGKSTLAAYKLLHFATQESNLTAWYIAPTYRQAKSIMWEMLSDIIPGEAILKRNETELVIKLRNGSEILLKGADNPDSLRGVRIDFAIFDEVAFFERWDEAWKVIRPTLMDSQAEVWFISTPNGFNHFKTLAETKDPDYSYFHFTTYDNPHIPKAEIDKSKDEMDESSFAQEILGEFRKMAGLIYKEFSRDNHMVDVPSLDGYSIFKSLDFGYAHKTALVYVGVNTTGTEMYIYDGLYQVGMTTKEIADACKIKDSGKHIQRAVADSAQPMMIEELKREGVNFEPVEKGSDSVKSGITQVAGLLKVRADTGKPTLMFSKNLDWIADEFERYRWMENKTSGFTKETPLKRDDDAMDAIRYFAMSYMKPAEQSYIDLPNEELGGFY